MSHLQNRNGYSSLMERLERFPQGAPPSELFAKILALLFTEQEAKLVGQLPMHPFSAARAAHAWGVREVEAYRTLEGLAERGLLLDTEQEGEKLYVLPPPMAGFLDFVLMRVRKDVDQPALSRLLDQYLNQEEEYIRDLYTGTSTPSTRIMVDEDQVPSSNLARLFNYERATEVVRGARRIGVGTCSCRQKMRHVGRGCSAPLETCMVFDDLADSLIRHGHARETDTQRCLELLQQSREQNLIQVADNAQSGVTSICNCCSCCCETLVRARKFCNLQPVSSTNYIAELRPERCIGCGRCIDACPAEAMRLVSANDPQHPWQRRCVQDRERCLGCGVCVRVCRTSALSLVPKAERVVTPVDNVHRLVLMALERGKLQHLIWDNRAMFNHRAMAAIVGAILRLPAVKQKLAASELGSRYLGALMQRLAERASRMPLRL
ncbi:4Fe-4S dicluster domain-containing protein [Geomonas subterranea]|uniref:4Fe-4S binding protein n=1 Tax=Geomonas subterranea TaxID=2847989 RepID=A0ABX8LH56_9BACT|nr:MULTISPECIES: 4Fe-4S binding protein [Geomonas]QXE90671.1 4Fe-4S binding protein [Geomonas subterranea]QXM11248.1 4Fe-4S binding protein [Geomonas subterranea]